MDTGGWNYVSVARHWRWRTVWVILLLAVSHTLPTVHGQEYFAKGCPGGEADSPPVDVTLTCPKGQVISLGEAKFGRNKYKHCTITDGDCLDKTDAFVGCKGRHTCTVHFDRPFSPTCGYVTFITVTYDCQTVTSTPPPLVHTPSVSRPVTVFTPVPNTVKTITGTGNTDSGLGEAGEDNAALIAGCVVAVVITIILLIIAIIMVVRRLACGSELSDEEEKKSSSCIIFPCMSGDHHGSESEAKARQNDDDDEADSSPHHYHPHHHHHNHDNTSRNSEDKKGNKRKRKHRGWWADKNQNMSSRLAPVGQEDEEEGGTPPPPPSSSQTRSSTVGAVGVVGVGASTTAPARASVYSEHGTSSAGGTGGAVGGGSSGRSSLAMELGAPQQLKRHSSGAKSTGSDFIKEQQQQQGGVAGGGEVSELDDFGRRGVGGGVGGGIGGGGAGGEAKGSMKRGIQTHQGMVGGAGLSRGGGGGVGGGKMNTTEFSAPAPIQDRGRGPPPAPPPASSRIQMHPSDKHNVNAAKISSSKRNQFDAVALPNTETFTSC